MFKMSNYLTAVSILCICAQVHAQNSCDEIRVGRYDKTFWDITDLSGGIQGEFIRQLERNDDLFSSLSPEISFGINDFLDFDFELSRKVEQNLPTPEKNMTVSQDDIFSHQVKNAMYMKFSANVSTGIIGAGGVAGINLVHTTQHIKNKKLNTCETLGNILDPQNSRSKKIKKTICGSRNKNQIWKYWDNVVNFLSAGVGKIFEFASINEANQIYAEDPLSPFKIHSMLGLPLDYKIFYESNKDIAFGDMVEHTTFYNLNLLNIRFNPFDFLTPSYSRFQRYYRTLAFKKIRGNKVIVEMKDAVISGNDASIYKIRPKLFGLIKLNFGKWGVSGFKEKSLLQHFEINLNILEGRLFFRKFIKMAYLPSISLGKKTILIDPSKYSKGVTAVSPVFSNGDNFDNEFRFKIPGTVSFSKRKHSRLNKVNVDGKQYLTGTKFVSDKFKNKLSFDLGFFEVTKAKRNFKCQMSIEGNKNYVDKNTVAMNFDCDYNNRYANNENLKEVIQTINMTVNGNIESSDLKALQAMDLGKSSNLSMSTKLSFSAKQLGYILNATDDQVYFELAKMLFGEDSEDVFSTKHKAKWNYIRHKYGRRAKQKMSPAKGCAHVFRKSGITKTFERKYSDFAGIVGNSKGLYPFRQYSCLELYKKSREITRVFKRIVKNLENESLYIESFLETFTGSASAGVIQNLFYRLSGGVDFGLHSSYMVNSSVLTDPIVQINGTRYTANIPGRELDIVSQMSGVIVDRIGKVEYFVNTCSQDKLKLNIDMNVGLDPKTNFFVKAQISRIHLNPSERRVQEIMIPVETTIREDGSYFIKIDASLADDFTWSETHTVTFQIFNEVGVPVTKQIKTFISAYFESDEPLIESDDMI